MANVTIITVPEGMGHLKTAAATSEILSSGGNTVTILGTGVDGDALSEIW